MLKNKNSFRIRYPNQKISNFVESFWMLNNQSDEDREIVVVPNGCIDIFFSYSQTEPFHIVLLGLESEHQKPIFKAKTITFAISLKLLAIEYLLEINIAHLLNRGQLLPLNFWNITKEDLDNFEEFCEKATDKINQLLKTKSDHIDNRKQKLFELIYASKGALTVKELSEQVFWSSRQINRYFNQHFGLTLKAYCNILRFKASFAQIMEGKLFPEQNFTDQAHFIKAVKKLSGATPKELFKNSNDRFIQFSDLTDE